MHAAKNGKNVSLSLHYLEGFEVCKGMIGLGALQGYFFVDFVHASASPRPNEPADDATNGV